MKSRNEKQVPTLALVQKVAQDLKGNDLIRRLILYGSVAKNQATPSSDIDLLAVFEDIDYRQRPLISQKISHQAEKISGWRTDVLATDWPELSWRLDNVKTSFERKVLSQSVVLFDRPIRPSRVIDKKAIGAETSDAGEALLRLSDSCEPLTTLQAARQAKLPAGVTPLRFDRRWGLARIRASIMILESAIKSLWHSLGVGWPDKTADAWSLAAKLPDGPAKQAILSALTPLKTQEGAGPNPAALTCTDWRPPGPLCDQIPKSWWHTKQRANLWAQTALTVAQIAYNQIPIKYVSGRAELADLKYCLGLTK